MQKMILMFLFSILSISLLANGKEEIQKVKERAIPVKLLDQNNKKVEPPCDSKEDLLKKLEEEKKKAKPFSLQGGNTGCSVDKKD
jgi:hypothetical protein